MGTIEKRIHREQEERRIKRGNVIQQMHYVLAIKLMTDKCAYSNRCSVMCMNKCILTSCLPIFSHSSLVFGHFPERKC